MTSLVEITVSDDGIAPPTASIEQERKIAIFDLLENNSFEIPARDGEERSDGPFELNLGIINGRLAFDVSNEGGDKVSEFHLSLGPFREVVRDYFQIFEAYSTAIIANSPSQIETIDMARRGIHNEGARVLQERLEGKAVVDTDTARRLFTLICVLQWGAR